MPIYKRPLEVQCSWCKKSFAIKYVAGKKDWSRKNNWGFWTEKEENKSKEICNACLLSLYKNKKIEFHELVSEKRKMLFRVYVANKKIY